ncbi:MAG TPA: response regulator [Methanospirillum sp.]|nr:response regulator [Methanospirillum sp.]
MARVLLVDRVSFNRDITRFALQYGGHEVIGEAEDGKEAVDLYVKFHPDLAILEIITQKLTGIEVLSFIKKMDPSTKIIICSSVTQSQVIRLSKVKGADSYIIKPFQIMSFLSEVNTVLGVAASNEALKRTGKTRVSEEDLALISSRILTRTITPEELDAFIKEAHR